MNLETRWLLFVYNRASASGKTRVYNVRSKDDGSLLGQIRWYARWRQYAFFPERGTIETRDCLRDIATFIDELMAERRT